MRVKDVVVEDFCNYKVPAMFIISSVCDWKCCTELGLNISICQNQPISKQPTKDISNEIIFDHYVSNPITKAIVVGGLEPMLQIDELVDLIRYFRDHGNNDPFVIYTGYYPEEIPGHVERVRNMGVVIKYGRYIPGHRPHYDDVLGVELASDNQYAVSYLTT